MQTFFNIVAPGVSPRTTRHFPKQCTAIAGPSGFFLAFWAVTHAPKQTVALWAAHTEQCHRKHVPILAPRRCEVGWVNTSQLLSYKGWNPPSFWLQLLLPLAAGRWWQSICWSVLMCRSAPKLSSQQSYRLLSPSLSWGWPNNQAHSLSRDAKGERAKYGQANA